MAEKKKTEKPATIKVSGKVHRVYKKKDGEIIVDHAGSAKKNGKWDTINLSDKAGAKTVKQGVAATKKWHKANPHTKGK